ncbi:MAG: hypothetical protein KDE20_29950, partial [Caldilineaceae bacterium]|nr:hypothetical protein [Caldilineaceae bacterium]
TVLTTAQVFQLGEAFSTIHQYFFETYGKDESGKNKTWYAMDIEFKFDGKVGEEPKLYIKQARPHPGRGK